MFNKAIEAKLHNLKEFGVLDHFLWDKIVFKKVREILGWKIRIICVGSAPIAEETLDFLKVSFSSPILEGYG